MSDFNQPTNASGYPDVLDLLKARDVDAITLCLADPTNKAVGTIRYNRATDLFEEWSGAAWVTQPIAIAGLVGGTAAAFRTALGLGTMAVQSSAAVAISGGTIAGDGSGLTALNGTNISTGTVPAARLGGGVPDATKVLVGDGQWKTITSTILGAIYPVGSIYFNATVATNPATLLGFGIWAAWGAGRVPVGVDGAQVEFDTLEETGGEKTHILTTPELASHNHIQDAHSHAYTPTAALAGAGDPSGAADNIKADRGTNPAANFTVGVPTVTANTTATNQAAGGGGAHNNLQPYITVYMWKRTA